jgi:hypothetical protein
MASTTYGPSGGVQYTISAPYFTLAGYLVDLTITYPAGSGPGGVSTTSVTGIPEGNVLTTNGGTLTAGSILGVSSYVIPPTITGTVDLALNLLGSTNVYIGGTATLNSGVVLGGSTTIDVDGGTANVSSTTIADALSSTTINIDNGGVFGNGTGLLSALSGSIIDFGPSGGTFLVSGGATNTAAINLSTVKVENFDAAKDNIEFQDLAAPVTSYSISTAVGGVQTITLLGSSGQTLGTVTVTGAGLPAGTVAYGQTGPLTLSGYDTTTVTIDPVASTLCFLSGTRIATPAGETAVENLRIADLVSTADGQAVPIVFIGRRQIDLTHHPRPQAVRPVRIRAGALADGIPRRDLLVSPDHALYLEGVLVPARDLVDGVCILHDQSFSALNYFHIELENHSILLAEGAGAESFVNVGHRGLFDNSDEPVLLHPELWHSHRETGSCAPLVFEGEKLAEIRKTLCARVARLGYGIAENAQFELNIDGRILTPVSVEGNRITFDIPAGATTGILTSPVFAPAEIDPASADRRNLGIAITEITVDNVQVELHATLNPSDLHPRAPDETATWTRGTVRITLPPDTNTLSLQIVAWPRLWQTIQHAA